MKDSDLRADPRAYERHWSTRLMQGLNRIYARAWHRVELGVPCTIPATGPAILICNHTAGLDPFLLQATCPRLITWMMAREYYEIPILQKICDGLGYIPVNRNGKDSASLKAALRALAAGKVLGVFPEGRIETTMELLPFQGGVGMMAHRAGVPVYPAYIAGLRRNMSMASSLFVRQDARVTYGPPVTRTGDQPLTGEQLYESVDRLRRQTLAHSPLRSRFSVSLRDSASGNL